MRHQARILYLLILCAEHMIVRFANDLFTVLIKDKHACQQCAKFPMGLDHK